MNTDQNVDKPTVERPLLIGLAVDVSGSMLEAIENRSGKAMNRLESFRDSFTDLVEGGRKLSSEGAGEKISPLVKIFAYGFGFGNPLSIIFGGAGPSVRDLLDLPGEQSSTISIDRLARDWPAYQRHIEQMAPAMFGGTPMGEALGIIRRRFETETVGGKYSGRPILFVLSDGEPTDLPPSAVAGLADELKRSGVLIVSCYVTDADIAEPRRLYGAPSGRWSDGAKLMFECSSVLPRSSPFEAYMAEYKWTVEPEGRLFTQINQSEILSEFLNVVLSPLRSDAGRARRSSPEAVRVFVSYSRQDEKYLSQDSLLGFLEGLRREGFEFWDDRLLQTGELWDDRIREEIGKADIALVLVSQGFLNSKYCRDVEVAAFMKKRSETGLRIYPVILSPCDWKSEEWLAVTQFQPRNNRTIETNYKDSGKRKALFLEIKEELRAIGQEVRASR